MIDVDWPKPYGYTIFCDDIRQEADGKIALMGVYGPDMNVPQFPFLLPFFCFAVRYIESPEDTAIPLEIHIYFPGDLENAPSQKISIPGGRPIPPPPPSDGHPEFDTRLGLSLNLKVGGITLKQQGRIKVRMIRGDQSIRLGALRVNPMPSDTVTLTPAAAN